MDRMGGGGGGWEKREETDALREGKGDVERRRGMRGLVQMGKGKEEQ